MTQKQEGGKRTRRIMSSRRRPTYKISKTFSKSSTESKTSSLRSRKTSSHRSRKTSSLRSRTSTIVGVEGR